jgi:hypothetical protein
LNNMKNEKNKDFVDELVKELSSKIFRNEE